MVVLTPWKYWMLDPVGTVVSERPWYMINLPPLVLNPERSMESAAASPGFRESTYSTVFSPWKLVQSQFVLLWTKP